MTVQETLRIIIEIQELDMKMLRLMRVRRHRQKELEQINTLREELQEQIEEKEKEIAAIDAEIEEFEKKIQEIKEKLKQFESQQTNIKKVDEFNALTQEMTSTEKQRIATEQQVSDLVDKKISGEELLEKIKTTLKESEESTINLEKEICDSIETINEEGRSLKGRRDELVATANPEVFAIYERLLKNKKDRVVVPLENRTCSGCHVTVTAQHENLVRKGTSLVFCEHCSRLHYWQESAPEGGATTTRRRRRRATT